MRLRFGLALPEKGGRSAIVAAEVFESRYEDKSRRWHYVVGYLDRPLSHTIEGAVESVRDLVLPVADLGPCVFVDVGTPQGLAARRTLKRDWPAALHRPHAYERTKFDTTTFATFLEAYADGRVAFRPDLAFRRDLDRALVLYRGGGTATAGDELESEDEAMVNALCLALSFPTHGEEPRDLSAKPVAPKPETSVMMGTLEIPVS